MQTKYTPKDIDRFWGKVKKPEDPQECWNWTASKVRQGYGHWGWNGKLYYSHRIAWELTFDEIPTGLEVCHSCDNPSCVNPNHLFLGTHKNNMEDRDAKGRRKPARGERNGKHKLTDGQVVEIRRRYVFRGIGAKNLIQELAREFGVDRNTIYRIANYKARA